MAFYHDWLDEQLDCTKANQFRYLHSTSVNGLRACCLMPGEVATTILKLRPVVPSEEEQARMLQSEDLGRSIAFIALPTPICFPACSTAWTIRSASRSRRMMEGASIFIHCRWDADRQCDG
ncbi:hypothetical protein ABIB66_001020 [Bradyrhizobium sp. F1.13.3]